MRVVVTRPERSGLKTAALLRARGHEAVILPLTKPVYDTDAVLSAFSKCPSVLAITSAEAIRAVSASSADIDAIKPVTVFTVGQASANAARSAGFDDVIAGQGTGRELAQTIFTNRNKTREGTIFYLAGTPHERGFEEGLSTLDIPFETVNVYEMQPVEWSRDMLEAIVTPLPPDVVLFYSSEAVRRFFDLFDGAGSEIISNHGKFICISEKVVSAIPEPLQSKAFAALTPSEAEMFDMLDRLAGT